MASCTTITRLSVRDIRFPTSLDADGSDAMHSDPDYSCAYVTIETDSDLKGFGFTFTIGRGTEIVVSAVRALNKFIVNQKLSTIFDDFAAFWRRLTSDTQLRWIGPEKGVIHLATAAVLNAIWDLWGKMEEKPVWKLLSDMAPEKLVSIIDFRYITDVLTKNEAIEILKKNQSSRKEREVELLKNGYPAYTTSAGWIGYSNEKIITKCEKALKEGWTKFKIKVGENIDDDIRRCKLVRETIGPDNLLMVDANQRWDVQTSIEWMEKLAEFKIHWIEEPTSPDDILGHATIAKALKPLGIGVATGEQAHNRVMFKQFFQADGMQFCQIDSCRLGSVNEIVAVLLMAAKFGVPVCPHAGGVGLSELVQHMIMFDYICISATKESRIIEFTDHLHEHFVHPVTIKDANYMPPQGAGYSATIKEPSLMAYEYPNGTAWQMLFREGEDNGKAIYWTKDLIILLIDQFKLHEEEIKSPRVINRIVWEKIAATITETAQLVTPQQCNNKWKSLKRIYKKIKDHNSTPGKTKRNWEFYEAFDNIYDNPEETNMPVVESQDSTIIEPLSVTPINNAKSLYVPSKSNKHSAESCSQMPTQETFEIDSNSTNPSSPPKAKKFKLDISVPTWFTTLREHLQQHDDEPQQYDRQASQNKLIGLIERLTETIHDDD